MTIAHFKVATINRIKGKLCQQLNQDNPKDNKFIVYHISLQYNYTCGSPIAIEAVLYDIEDLQQYLIMKIRSGNGNLVR